MRKVKRKGWLVLSLCAALVVVSAARQAAKTQQPSTWAFTNGQWFDGASFQPGTGRPRTVYAVAGRFTFNKPKRIDQTLDLAGSYVIPPFGEAHNHNVESSRIDAVSKMYLDAGIFYVKNPNSLARFTTPLLGKVNVPTGIDVIFSGGGLTGSGGHPTGIVRRNVERRIWTEADGEGGFYFTIDSRDDLNRKWESVLAGKPDFIKTYLLYSEEYAKRKDDAAYLDWRGLDPALLPEIVKRAHRAGLRVVTHVESAADFHQAVAAGVDEINHLPGFRPDRNDQQAYDQLARYEIAAADARLAAKRGIVVVTTIGDIVQALSRIDEKSASWALSQQVKAMLTRNLQMLKQHGVRIAIGSDAYTRSSLYEAQQLHSLRVFDNLTLLKLWTENTPAAIFPKRKLGQLKEGYEASFLALATDPLADFENVKRIRFKFKQGVLLGGESK